MKVSEIPYACALCQDTFSAANALVSHVQNKHGSVKNSEAMNTNSQDRIEDDKSNKQISKETERQKSKEYSCKNCHKTFSFSKSLRQHHLNNHREKRFSCTFCMKKFSENFQLKDHEKIHTNEKPYACTFCDKTFYFKRNRKAHEMIHTGEKHFHAKSA